LVRASLGASLLGFFFISTASVYKFTSQTKPQLNGRIVKVKTPEGGVAVGIFARSGGACFARAKRKNYVPRPYKAHLWNIIILAKSNNTTPKPTPTSIQILRERMWTTRRRSLPAFKVGEQRKANIGKIPKYTSDENEVNKKKFV
jgi:hypothetical protein